MSLICKSLALARSVGTVGSTVITAIGPKSLGDGRQEICKDKELKVIWTMLATKVEIIQS